MALIGMPEAGRRMGVSSDSARRTLLNAGLPMQRINAKAWAVEESDLEAFMKSRSDYMGRGRPGGTRKRTLAEFNCNCGAAVDSEHKTYCPRGRAYRRRLASGVLDPPDKPGTGGEGVPGQGPL